MQLGHKDGKLQVFYSDRLVTLLREVRQLTALGFVVPAKIQHTASMANRFYRQAVILKQVLWTVCYIPRDFENAPYCQKY